MRNTGSGASVLDRGPRRRDNASHAVASGDDIGLDDCGLSRAVLDTLSAASHGNDGSAVVEHGRGDSDRS